MIHGQRGRAAARPHHCGRDFVQIYNMYNYWNKDYHAFVRYSYIDQEDNVWLCGKSAIHLFNIESGHQLRQCGEPAPDAHHESDRGGGAFRS